MKFEALDSEEETDSGISSGDVGDVFAAEGSDERVVVIGRAISKRTCEFMTMHVNSAGDVYDYRTLNRRHLGEMQMIGRVRNFAGVLQINPIEPAKNPSTTPPGNHYI